MAGLGNGCFRFSNSVNSKKSHVYLKLTESAQKALEEFLKCRNNCKSQPTIAFNSDYEGEIKFPSQNHEGSTFKFQMQKAESDAPQGSFESIRQGDNHSLDSLGPLMSVMRIQANDDSYGRAKGLLAHAMAQNGKTCVKELNTNGMVPRHRPTRPQKTGVPPGKKEPTSFTPAHFASNIYSSHNGNSTTSSTSPHPTNAVNKTSWNPPIKPPHLGLNGKKVNEALKKRPLRERIIQLLAHKPMNKLQLMNKLHSDGIKECDKRNITSTVQGIATLKDSVYHLPKHMWSEVNENWSFFTEEEKLSVMRNNPLKHSPPRIDIANIKQSPKAKNSFSPSTTSELSESLKRQVESNYHPTVKKARAANSRSNLDVNPRIDRFANSSNGFGPSPVTKGGELESRLSPTPCYDPEVRTSTRPSRFSKKNYPSDNQSKLQEKRLDPIMSSLQDSSLMNGHHSPSGASVSPLSQNNSPKNIPNGHNNNNNNNKSDANNYSLTNGLVSQVPEGRRNGLSRKDKTSGANSQLRNGMMDVEDTSPSPENQQENVDTIDTLDNFKLRYLPIEDNEQRRRYKSDFNRIYANYKVLHSELEKIKLFFKEIDVRLEAHEYGSPEYIRIKERMLIEYNKRQPNFQEKKQRYYYLDEVLKHIKQLVSEYDSVQRF